MKRKEGNVFRNFLVRKTKNRGKGGKLFLARKPGKKKKRSKTFL